MDKIDRLDKRFNKHLDKVCKNANIKSWAQNYLNDFAKYYGDKVFTPEDFESLTYSGKTFKPEIVKTIFSKHKQTATPKEVGLYLFTHNVKSMKAVSPFSFLTKSSKGYRGIYHQNKSVIRINGIGMRKSFIDEEVAIKPSVKNGCSIKKDENGKFNIVQRATNYLRTLPQRVSLLGKANEHYKEHSGRVIYHEISHACEDLSYGSSLVARGSALARTTQFARYCKEIKSTSIIKNVLSKIGINYFSKSKNEEDKYNHFYISGLRQISEINNEIFSSKVFGNFNIEEMKVGKNFPFQKRMALRTDCAYNRNYDVAEFLKIVSGVRDLDKWRFCPNQTLNIARDKMNVSPEFIQDVLKNNHVKYCLKDETNPFDMVVKLTGFANDIRSFKQEPFKMGVINGCLKMASQALLIESFKNNILTNLANPDVAKDGAFFEQLNSDMQTINSFVMMRNICKSIGGNEYNIKDILSVREMIKETPDMICLKPFNSLIEEVKDYVQQNNLPPEIVDKMTFLKEQQQLENYHQQLLQGTSQETSQLPSSNQMAKSIADAINLKQSNKIENSAKSDDKQTVVNVPEQTQEQTIPVVQENTVLSTEVGVVQQEENIIQPVDNQILPIVIDDETARIITEGFKKLMKDEEVTNDAIIETTMEA